MVNKWSKIIQNLVGFCKSSIGNTCYICYQTNINDAEICDTCCQWLPWLRGTCQYCAYPLVDAVLCGACLGKTHDLDHLKALFRYESPIKQLVLNLKFQQKLYPARLFSQYFLKYFQPNFSMDAIIAVPLAKERLKARGYNQSIEIAKELSKQLAIPLYTDVLFKERDTKSQSDLNKQQREHNLKYTDFKLSSSFSGKRVLLIDDVYTTGTTLRCVAKQLKACGVEYVEAWVVCRSL